MVIKYPVILGKVEAWTLLYQGCTGLWLNEIFVHADLLQDLFSDPCSTRAANACAVLT